MPFSMVRLLADFYEVSHEWLATGEFANGFGDGFGDRLRDCADKIKAPGSDAQYMAWISGDIIPCRDIVIRLASILDVEPEWLLFGERTPCVGQRPLGGEQDEDEQGEDMAYKLGTAVLCWLEKFIGPAKAATVDGELGPFVGQSAGGESAGLHVGEGEATSGTIA